SDVDVYMECTITHLITGPGRIMGAFGYWRVTGEPVLFPAKAVVLATGGIGKAYEVTSSSWEYSGDGHALAYLAGAELIDMEFVQFHPTGMVWPPGVRGLLVTEAVRGEGGILRNKDGERFMSRYLPEDRRGEYASTDEEAAKWVTAQAEGRVTDARRPPELSTRDNVQVRDAARELAAPLEQGSGEDPYALQRDLQDVMQRLVGIFRVEADLQEATAELAKLKARYPAVAVRGGRTFNPGWNLVFELRNLLVVSEAITRSALQRTESRGAHSRIDHPETDQAGWGG